MMTHNQLQKHLQDHNMDKRISWYITHLHENQIELSRQLDMAANLIAALTETVSNFVQLNEAQQAQVKKLLKERRGGDGIDVASVLPEPEVS